jgi:hypothetical protein
MTRVMKPAGFCFPGRPRPRPTGQGDNGDMICVHCRERHHEDCPGGTWCDCQHLPPADAEHDPEHAPEPPLTWVRQG